MMRKPVTDSKSTYYQGKSTLPGSRTAARTVVAAAYALPSICLSGLDKSECGCQQVMRLELDPVCHTACVASHSDTRSLCVRAAVCACRGQKKKLNKHGEKNHIATGRRREGPSSPSVPVERLHTRHVLAMLVFTLSWLSARCCGCRGRASSGHVCAATPAKKR
eukprot:g72425.t1